MRLRVLLLTTLVLACGAAGCGPQAPAQDGGSGASADVDPRFSGLSRLVVFRPSGGTPFFLDRFETTRREFERFLRVQPRDVEPLAELWTAGSAGHHTEDWPANAVTPNEARAFAAWRFGRLPRDTEFAYAIGGEIGYKFPWGDRFQGFSCNTADLGLNRLTPVGTFEPVGYVARDPCYDLVGNVAEMVVAVRDERSPEGVDLIIPVGWHFRSHYVQGSVPTQTVGHEYRAMQPTERDANVGLRVATDPETLLSGLLMVAAMPGEIELESLRRFLREHRDVLRPALKPARPADGALTQLVRTELR